MRIRLLLLPACALLVLTACASGSDQAALEGDTADAGGPDVVYSEPLDVAGDESAAFDDDSPAADDADEDAAGSGVLPGGDRQESLPAVRQVATGSERIIKEGTMTIEVGEDEFLTALQRVMAAARELGGFVTASTSSSSDDGGTRGSVTVRVPVDNYEDLLTRVGGIGRLRSQDVTSRDVTGEFTDLESRLRHLRAQEAFYLGLLEEADSVQDAIAVQQHLDNIQSQIEQIQGRLNLLEDRTSFSTLTVELFERGTDPVTAFTAGQPMLSDYWQTARDGFVRVVGWILVTSVSLAPIVVPLLIAAMLWRTLRRRPTAPPVARVEGE